MGLERRVGLKSWRGGLDWSWTCSAKEAAVDVTVYSAHIRQHRLIKCTIFFALTNQIRDYLIRLRGWSVRFQRDTRCGRLTSGDRWRYCKLDRQGVQPDSRCNQWQQGKTIFLVSDNTIGWVRITVTNRLVAGSRYLTSKVDFGIYYNPCLASLCRLKKRDFMDKLFDRDFKGRPYIGVGRVIFRMKKIEIYQRRATLGSDLIYTILVWTCSL